ncbi:hypothetical protein [Streptomyces aurantiacus]|nr:hypothetical protein [Streptomyces aurantiacus]
MELFLDELPYATTRKAAHSPGIPASTLIMKICRLERDLGHTLIE